MFGGLGETGGGEGAPVVQEGAAEVGGDGGEVEVVGGEAHRTPLCHQEGVGAEELRLNLWK